MTLLLVQCLLSAAAHRVDQPNTLARDNDAYHASIVIVTFPKNGTAVVDTNGIVTYSHNGSETVSDSFTYTANDIEGATSDPASVSITIDQGNDAPQITSRGVTSSTEEQLYVYNISAIDPNGDELKIDDSFKCKSTLEVVKRSCQ